MKKRVEEFYVLEKMNFPPKSHQLDQYLGPLSGSLVNFGLKDIKLCFDVKVHCLLPSWKTLAKCYFLKLCNTTLAFESSSFYGYKPNSQPLFYCIQLCHSSSNPQSKFRNDFYFSPRFLFSIIIQLLL